jgi:hypothetical protein
MRDENRGSIVGRIVLALLTAYALAMIVPDLWRIVRPLGSFGLMTNADGLIYDVRGPFDRDEDSPAWRAGLRAGDQLNLAGMRCVPVNTEVCASNQALWGGLTYVLPGREATLLIAAEPDHPAREVKLVAEPRPASRALDIVLLLTQVAGGLVVLGAAWLVWTRPGLMTWGFFVYMMQFNPGQAFLFYAWLQQWPVPLMIQEVSSCVLQAAGFVGFLLFALRAPVDHVGDRWRWVEQALPALAVIFLLVNLASLGSLFGYETELWMRASTLMGFPVGVAALLILLGRRSDLTPRDYQRLRWVIWGCLIGLPAYLIGELSQETSLFTNVFGEGGVPEDVSGLFYLINGVLCLFVVEAVRRPTVVNVSIPLRRVTVLGLLLSVPAFFIHEELGTINEHFHLPDWAWVLLASALVFLISRAHELAAHLADKLFDLKFRRADEHLAKVGREIRHAESLGNTERLLIDEPVNALRLASAAVFREQDGAFRRRMSVGWDTNHLDELLGTNPLLTSRFGGAPFALHGIGVPDATESGLPDDLARPILVVPIGNPRRCYAVALYGGHETGTDLSDSERALLARLAREAEIAYGQIESAAFRARIGALEDQLAATLAKG